MSFYIILDTLQEIASNDKLQRLRWEYEAQNDLLPIPFTGCPYVVLGKREYYCHQGQDFNQNKKEMHRKQKNEALKQDHIYKASRKHTQPTKKMDCPVKFCFKKIYLFTSYKLTCNTKHNQEKVTQLLREDLKNSKEKNKVFGSLQYLVIFPNENDHKFNCTGEAATFIQPVDARVTEFIRKQIKEDCRVPKDMQSRTEYFVRETIFDGQKTKEIKRKTFVSSRKKIRNLILLVRNDTRYLKIDQENISHLKAQWKDYGDILFQPFRKDSVDHIDEVMLGKKTMFIISKIYTLRLIFADFS